MDDEALRKVQLTQLEILKELDRVCNEIGIHYFLDSGTLLGAVRHRGFIPWDDDLDVGMLRKDYETFIKEGPKYISNRFFIQNWESDDGFGLAFSKIRKNGTRFVEMAAESAKAHNGIYIDLFPYDVYPTEVNKQKYQKWRYFFYRRLMLAKCGYKPWKTIEKNRIKNAIGYCLLRLLSLFFSKKTIKKKYYAFATKYNNDYSQFNFFYPQAGASGYGKWLVPAECLQTTSTIWFEDGFFSCPSKPDLYLSKIYGDYMTLPPEEKRMNRHKIIEVNFGED